MAGKKIGILALQGVFIEHQQGMAIWGTCAGMVLLAQEIVNMDQPVLGLMEIAVVRNGIGRQVDSFETDLDIDGLGRAKGGHHPRALCGKFIKSLAKIYGKL